ncbi:hypothetical protein [Methylobacterium bullatum]|uniref:hypothetical protein n=1 Tax=Methylobacterium bullatum TaxID=570505 RepID=UPI001EE27F16|nr:hypothetical protein [Methylobacterium bullatum]
MYESVIECVAALRKLRGDAKCKLSVNNRGVRELVAGIHIVGLYAHNDPCEVRTAQGPVTAMPVFEAKNLDSEFEGQALLAAILFPTQEAQDRALTHGRNRAARGCAMADPLTIEARYPHSLRDPEIEVQLS